MLLWVGLSVAVVIGVLGLVFAGLGISERRRLAEVVARPTTPIAEVRPGRMEVAGRVLDGNTFEAPISKKPAVYAEVYIEHANPEVKRGSVEVRRGDGLSIRDDTGTATVKLTDAQIEIERDEYRLYGDAATDGEPPEGVEALLRAEGRDVGRVLSWSERRIEPGTPLYVLGRARVVPAVSVVGSSDTVVFEADDDDPLLISVGTETEVRSTLRFGARLAFGLAVSCLIAAGAVTAVTLFMT